MGHRTAVKNRSIRTRTLATGVGDQYTTTMRCSWLKLMRYADERIDDEEGVGDAPTSAGLQPARETARRSRIEAKCSSRERVKLAQR